MSCATFSSERFCVVNSLRIGSIFNELLAIFVIKIEPIKLTKIIILIKIKGPECSLNNKNAILSMFELNASMLSSAKKEDYLILLPFIIAKAVINKFDKEQDKTTTQIK